MTATEHLEAALLLDQLVLGERLCNPPPFAALTSASPQCNKWRRQFEGIMFCIDIARTRLGRRS